MKTPLESYQRCDRKRLIRRSAVRISPRCIRLGLVYLVFCILLSLAFAAGAGVSPTVSPNSSYQPVAKLVVRYHPDSLERATMAKLPAGTPCELRSDESLLPGDVVVDHLLEDGRVSATVDLASMERVESE